MKRGGYLTYYLGTLGSSQLAYCLSDPTLMKGATQPCGFASTVKGHYKYRDKHRLTNGTLNVNIQSREKLFCIKSWFSSNQLVHSGTQSNLSKQLALCYTAGGGKNYIEAGVLLNKLYWRRKLARRTREKCYQSC